MKKSVKTAIVITEAVIFVIAAVLFAVFGQKDKLSNPSIAAYFAASLFFALCVSHGLAALASKHKWINILLYIPLLIFSTFLISWVVLIAVLDKYPDFVFYGIVLGFAPVWLASVTSIGREVIRGTGKEPKPGISSSEAIVWSMVVKCAQIPSYIFLFIVGLLSFLALHVGVIILLFVVIVDLVTIIMSGTVALFAIAGLLRDGRVKKVSAVFLIIGSYIYCVDVAIAIGLVIYNSAKYGKQKLTQKGTA